MHVSRYKCLCFTLASLIFLIPRKRRETYEANPAVFTIRYSVLFLLVPKIKTDRKLTSTANLLGHRWLNEDTKGTLRQFVGQRHAGVVQLRSAQLRLRVLQTLHRGIFIKSEVFLQLNLKLI